MREEVKTVVSQFLQVNSDTITDSTIIDRSSLGSSVLVHRMYAKLAEVGFPVQNYHDIILFGDLVRRVNGDSAVSGSAVPYVPISVTEQNGGIGIDIENVNSMPRCNDFREDYFYLQNFTQGEISHCIVSVDPYASFAGLFAVKEAIYKAGIISKSVPFSSIEIIFGANGKPIFGDIKLSISHTETVAIAIAYRQDFQQSEIVPSKVEVTQADSIIFKVLAVIALLLSLVSLFLIIMK